MSFFLSAFTLMIAASPASACRCKAPPAPKVAMEQATAVFVGKVVSVEPNRSHGVNVTFEVNRAWKGVDGKTMLITTPTHSCGHRFEKGKDYIVYATAKGGGVPDTNLCHRTKALSAADEDLKELGDGKAPVPHE